MNKLLIFIGGVAVGFLAVTGIYAAEETSKIESCEDVVGLDDGDKADVDDRLEGGLKPGKN